MFLLLLKELIIIFSLVISHFGFESRICLLIAPVPVHCFLITFTPKISHILYFFIEKSLLYFIGKHIRNIFLTSGTIMVQNVSPRVATVATRALPYSTGLILDHRSWINRGLKPKSENISKLQTGSTDAIMSHIRILGYFFLKSYNQTILFV